MTLRWALDGRARGVIALGLTGREALYDNEPFRGIFADAAAEGLRRVAHAGEHAGPASVRSALAVVGAERIGHGVRAIEDPALVEELAARQVPLEICPTSNVCLGIAPTIADHPFDRLRRAGVRAERQLRRPADVQHHADRRVRPPGRGLRLLGRRHGRRWRWRRLRHSFLPPDEKARLEADFRRQFAALGAEILGQPVEV